MSIALTKIYVQIWINGTSVMCSQKFTFTNQVITYKCFWICVHYKNNYWSCLLALHIRLTHAFIKAGTYVHHTDNYQSNFLTLHIRLVHTVITWRNTRVVYWFSIYMFITQRTVVYWHLLHVRVFWSIETVERSAWKESEIDSMTRET